MLTLCLGMGACSNGTGKATAHQEPTRSDVVEVLYFHGARRCATCMAIEKNTKELVESAFANIREVIESVYAEELKSGRLLFRSVDISEERAVAEKYEVSWSSLIIVDYDKSGKERATDLTEFAFGHARKAPEEFKAGLSERIIERLNN